MTDVNFLNSCIDRVNNLRAKEFKTFDFTYEEKVIEPKVLNENLQEYKSYQSKIKKKALMEKNKPGNITKKDFDTTNEGDVDIFNDDIFNNSNSEEIDEDSKLNIEALDRDGKLSIINEFLQRKNIILEESEKKKIEDIVDNPDVVLKKYLNVSKIYQHIIKITFIKKLENGSYIVNLNESKSKKTKKYFLK
jgi:NACalpha-BTF3-like transcription factor